MIVDENHTEPGRNENWATHFLLSFLKIEKDGFVISKATFSKSQTDTISVG